MTEFEIITFAHGSVDETGNDIISDYCYIISKDPMTSDEAKNIISKLNKLKVEI
jgi:hypothetical protein